MPNPPTKSSGNDNEKSMGLFMKLLALLLKMFGFELGEGVPLDDKFISDPVNRKMVKDKVEKMLDNPLGKTVLNLGLKIPGVRDMVKAHLDQNPNLKELAKEIIAENPSLQQKLSGHREFSDLLPNKSAGVQMRPTPPESADIEPELKELRGMKNPGVQDILNEYNSNTPSVPLSPMPNTPNRAQVDAQRIAESLPKQKEPELPQEQPEPQLDSSAPKNG